MFVLGTIAAALSCASAFDSQKPLTDPLEQDPLAVDVDAAVDVDVAPTLNADNFDQKPLVSSEKLQAKIDKHSLLSRAKELYEIAKASEDEYNHPTRVIGSPGRFYHRHRHRHRPFGLAITRSVFSQFPNAHQLYHLTRPCRNFGIHQLGHQ